MLPIAATGSARSWARLDGVDLLRGLAILFVLMNHVNMQLLFAHVPYTRGLPRQLVSTLVWNGQYGVQMFFAVSGFLITATSLRRWGSLDRVEIGRFYAIRFARIAPLLLALLLVLSGLSLAGVHNFVVSAKTGGLPNALWAALTFRSNLLEARRGYLPGNWDVLWSLSVEETFYLFFPLLCRVTRPGRRLWLLLPVLAAFVIAGPFARSPVFNHNPVWQEYSYLGGMDAIALGVLTALALAWRRPGRRLLVSLGLSGAALVICSLCFSRQAYAWGLVQSGLDMSVLAIGTCLLIALAAETGWAAPTVLVPLVVLGRRSYEIYLTHMFLVIAVAALFLHIGKPLWAVPLFFGSVILLAASLGELVARGYAEPANRWLRTRWHTGPSQLGTATASPNAAQLEA